MYATHCMTCTPPVLRAARARDLSTRSMERADSARHGAWRKLDVYNLYDTPIVRYSQPRRTAAAAHDCWPRALASTFASSLLRLDSAGHAWSRALAFFLLNSHQFSSMRERQGFDRVNVHVLHRPAEEFTGSTRTFLSEWQLALPRHAALAAKHGQDLAADHITRHLLRACPGRSINVTGQQYADVVSQVDGNVSAAPCCSRSICGPTFSPIMPNPDDPPAVP